MDALLAPGWLEVRLSYNTTALKRICLNDGDFGLYLEKALGYRPALKGTAEDVIATYNAMSEAPPPGESVNRRELVLW